MMPRGYKAEGSASREVSGGEEQSGAKAWIHCFSDISRKKTIAGICSASFHKQYIPEPGKQ